MDVVFEDRAIRPDVAPVQPCGPGPCLPSELCGVLPDAGMDAGSGNGLDDDCNGLVDDGCVCSTGEREGCFPGPADRRNVGRCRSGTATCTEDQRWSACTGAILPSEELCNGLDDDCDGMVDEELSACARTVACPAYLRAAPLSTVHFDGLQVRQDAAAFQWSVSCPPTVLTCPAVAAPSASELAYTVLQSGTYEVHLGVTLQDGTVQPCDFPLFVRGNGLRTELTWRLQGGLNSVGADLDLHLVAMDPRREARHWFSLEDCYYTTCLAPGGRVQWALDPSDARFAPTTDLSVCSGAPSPFGALWTQSGRCWNPRLDTDNLRCDPALRDPSDPKFCHAENINVDDAPEDLSFRAAVNFYQDHGLCADSDPSNDWVYPELAVYCGGELRAWLGAADIFQVPMSCTQNQGLGSSNWSWLAADIKLFTNACGVRDCSVRSLRVEPGIFPLCAQIVASSSQDVCADESGNVFVRRNGGRPVDAELPESF